MKEKIKAILATAAERAFENYGDRPISVPPVQLEAPRVRHHGDYATNIAMVVASQGNQSPRVIAGAITENIKDPEGIIDRVEIAGP